MASRRKHLPDNAAERTCGIYTVKLSHNKKTIVFTNTEIYIAPTGIDASVRPFFYFPQHVRSAPADHGLRQAAEAQ